MNTEHPTQDFRKGENSGQREKEYKNGNTNCCLVDTMPTSSFGPRLYLEDRLDSIRNKWVENIENTHNIQSHSAFS